MVDQPVLAVSGISKRFPGVWALRGVTFDVAPGEVHGLVGENGAGKSTLMAVASGAMAPDEGRVLIAGMPVSGDPERARDSGLAIVRQEPALMPDLTVAENLYLGMPAGRRPPVARLGSWAEAVLARWDPDAAIDAGRRVDQLNSEQRFIVEIAKALAVEPRVLILDEPTEHLLADDVGRLFAQIRRVAATGAGIVYISHRIREVKEISTRVTVLRDGLTRGTFGADELTEAQIVELIVGTDAEHEFPPKARAVDGRSPALSVVGYTGNGFSGVALDVFPGEIVGLGGMDGNGKREFMRALAGIAPGSGSVRVGGRPVRLGNSGDAAAAGIQYLSGARQKEGIFADLSVRENFSFRSLDKDAVAGFIGRSHQAGRARRAVEAFAVKTPTIETPIAALSGGNQQKVAMSGVLAREPAVILIDEPTQGVDVGARAAIYRTLRDVAGRGAAVLLISSDAAEVAGLSDRVAVFSRGQIVQELDGDAVSESAITTAVLTSGSLRGRSGHRASRSDRLLQWLAGYWAPLVMVAAIIALLGLYASLINAHYLTAFNIGGMLAIASTLVLVACAQQMLMLVGGIDLSVGPLMGLVVVVQSHFLVTGATPAEQALGWGLAIAVSVAVGLLNWALVDPIGMHPMVATLSTFMALQALSLTLRPIPGGLIDDGIMDAVNARWGVVPVMLMVGAGLVAVLELALFHTPWGVRFRAFGSRPEAARLAGISPRATRLAAYVACSVIAGLAAVAMMGQVGIGDPKSGSNYTLASIAAAVIGGASLFGARGSFVGALLGAFLISQVNVVTSFIGLNDAWRALLLGCLIVLAVAFYSKGRQLVVAR